MILRPPLDFFSFIERKLPSFRSNCINDGKRSTVPVLTQMARKKEERAAKYSDLVDLFSERVFNLAIRMLGNREDAEEATQDVFMRIYKSMDGFRGDSSLSTWIWRITANVCITRSKKRKADAVSLENSHIDPPDGQVGTFSKQENSLYRNEVAGAVNGYISMLPTNESAVLTLFYLEELSYDEIAEILKMPIGTVSINLHRGKARLRKLLKGKGI